MFTFNLRQTVLSPTRITPSCSNILDLFFTNIHDYEIVSQIVSGFSDHEAVTTKIGLSFKPYIPPKRSIFIFNKSNWDQMKFILANKFKGFKDECLKLSSNDIWVKIKEFIIQLMNDNIPTKEINSLNKRPWINRKLKALFRKQRNLHSLVKRWNDPIDKNRFCLIRAKASTLNDKLFNEYIQKSLDDGDHSKTFWRYIKSLKREPGIPSVRDSSGVLTTDSRVKANIFNNVLMGNYNFEAAIQVDPTEREIVSEMFPITIAINGITKLLARINASKSAGPDAIPGRILRTLAFELSPFLEILFKKILDTCQVPAEWKTAFVVPIPKGGDKHNPENYRPISLTCIVSRIFEHILHSSIYSHLQFNNLISSTQHGFRKGLSCETQLVSIIHDLAEAIDNRFETDVVFLDFKKAFDRVPHCHLLSKLKCLKINSSVVAIIESFLTGRSQKVIVEGALSDAASVPSGVPQGSVLGPLLFLCFINDMADKISSKIRFFADDCCLYKVHQSDCDQVILQNDLDTIMEWCSKWGMELNLKKCVYMTVSRKRNQDVRSYFLGGHKLDKVRSYKYLGVTISDNLDWNDQINGVVMRANKALGFVRRNLKNCQKDTKLKCYKTLVRPHLEYATSSWDPFRAAQIHRLEMVQRRSARFITGKYSRFESVSTLLEDLNISKLQSRREIARKKLFFKIDSKLIPLSTPNDLVRKVKQGRTDNGRSYNHFKSKTNPFFSTFFPKTVRDWNELPAEVVSSSSLSVFSNKLKDAIGCSNSTPNGHFDEQY
jgi:hypothetical protein